MLRPVLKMIENSDSLKEIKLNLADTYPEMDTKELEELLAQALYISDLIGRVSVASE